MLTGKQKAALLLSSLDAHIAAELIKGIDEQMVRELAVEMSYLDLSGHCSQSNKIEAAREFCASIKGETKTGGRDFLDAILRQSVGNEKAADISNSIDGLLFERDPFIELLKTPDDTLASVLNQEHPQAAAVILSRLDAKRSSVLMKKFSDELRMNVISRMTGSDAVSPASARRIAKTISQKITALRQQSAQDGGSEKSVSQDEAKQQNYRKVAVILRNLEKELCDALLDSVKKTDAQAAEQMANLMVLWEDIVLVEDRSLQNALRGIDAQKLALALFKADEHIEAKIKNNISERASETIAEETSLMSNPKADEIAQAREDVVASMRELNSKGELNFIEQ